MSTRFNFFQIFIKSEFEFNEFEPRLKSAKKLVSIERRFKSWNIKHNLKWNQPYLSCVSNLSRGSNSLISASLWQFRKILNIHFLIKILSFNYFHLLSLVTFCTNHSKNMILQNRILKKSGINFFYQIVYCIFVQWLSMWSSARRQVVFKLEKIKNRQLQKLWNLEFL